MARGPTWLASGKRSDRSQGYKYWSPRWNFEDLPTDIDELVTALNTKEWFGNGMGLTWSGRWHYLKDDTRNLMGSGEGLCGTWLFMRNNMPAHLRRELDEGHRCPSSDDLVLAI